MRENSGMPGFLGCGWKFPPEADPITGRIRMSSCEEDIAEAVRIILFTGKGERAMRPDFGCSIRKYAFSDMSAIDLRSMEQEISDALIRYEPRITKLKVSVIRTQPRDGVIEIRVSYVVRTTNNPYNLVFPYYLNEGN